MGEWSELYSLENEPTYKDISRFIESDLWWEIHIYLQKIYKVKPKL